MSGKRYVPRGQKAKRFAEPEKTPTVLHRSLAVLLSATVLAAALPAVSFGVDAATTGTTTDYLNLRKGAGSEYEVIRVLNNNSTVTVLDTTNTSWFKVRLSDGTTGYCSSEYLNLKGTATTTDYLNLRKGAGKSYSVITVMPKGEKVQILSTSGSWAQVKTQSGTVGYCSVEYLNHDVSSSVTLSASSLTMTKGSSRKLTASESVIWSSSNSSIVSVNSDGTVKALKEGTATITAKTKDGTSSAVCKITVNAQKIQSIKLSATQKTLYIGESFKLNATTVPENCALKYDTDNRNVISLSWNGKITALAEGTAHVTVFDSEGIVKEVCTVTVKERVANSLPAAEENCSMAVGGTKILSCENAASWSTDTSELVQVDSRGFVKGLSAGTAHVYAKDKYGNILLHARIAVRDQGFTSISIGNPVEDLSEGDSFSLNAVTNTGKGELRYKSENTDIASVDENGKVTGLKEGKTTLIVYDKTSTIQARLTVSVWGKCTVTISQSTASVRAGSSVCLKASTNNNSAIKWTSSNENIASVKNGVVSGFKQGTVTITAASADGSIKKTCKVTVEPSYTGSVVSISRSSDSVSAGQTLYLTGKASQSKAQWKSSDTSIATVSNGFVYAKSAGKVAITVDDAYGHRAVCVVTVKEAEPIQFSYSSPNSATLNSTVTFVAITDKTRSNVKFVVEENGTTKEVEATSKTADGDTYVWKATYKATSAGSFTVKAYSLKSGEGAWKTCTSGTSTMFVSSQTNKKQTAVRSLRASDELIKFIALKEGFVSEVTPDTLANNIPTLGHGYVVWEGDTFYNNLTKTQGYALLVEAVNNGVYTEKVNEMFIENNVAFNQQQFDALVSFSYNLGTSWTYSSDLKDILLSSIGTDTSNTVLQGTVNTSSGLNLRTAPTASADVITVLSYGDSVTLLSSQKYNSVWYKVKTQSGTVGYCSSSYLTVKTTNGVKKDLTYVNKNALIREMLSYHHAGGVCYYGLLYRRADELEMFLYGDYAADGRDNKYNFPNPSCIQFP